MTWSEFKTNIALIQDDPIANEHILDAIEELYGLNPAEQRIRYSIEERVESRVLSAYYGLLL